MSTKWKLIGTNALEASNSEYVIVDPKERKKVHDRKQWKAFKQGMMVDRMKVNKAKRTYKKDDMEDAEAV